MEKRGFVRELWWTILAGMILMAVVFFLIRVISIVPVSYGKYTNLIQALLFGLILYVILQFILKSLKRTMEKRISKKYVRPLIFLVSVVGYFVILLVILDILGVNLSSIILGSAFAGAIIGLAAQQILSNFFSGVLLIWSRPFEPGDYIEFSSWQYSNMLPSYPPKYLSRDEFRAKIAGIVDDISMNFTTIIEEGGTITKLPNSVVIQGAVTVNPSRSNILIRIELLKNIDFEKFRRDTEEILRRAKIINSTVSVEEIGRETYLVKITGISEKGKADEVRNELMEKLLTIAK
jgi:small-conductance mechanosensitive channel